MILAIGLLAIHHVFAARFPQTEENVGVVRRRLSVKFKANYIHTLREDRLPFFRPFHHLPSSRIFHRETARSQATKAEAIPDATRASQIAFAFSGASFVPRHFSEFPTFSISAETLVNIGERKAWGPGAGTAGRGLPKCEIMYKAGMNNDSAVIHCGRDARFRHRFSI